MAWVTQEFKQSWIAVTLGREDVEIWDREDDVVIALIPDNKSDAHAWAMMLRRAARRLEEIGKELP